MCIYQILRVEVIAVEWEYCLGHGKSDRFLSVPYVATAFAVVVTLPVIKPVTNYDASIEPQP